MQTHEKIKMKKLAWEHFRGPLATGSMWGTPWIHYSVHLMLYLECFSEKQPHKRDLKYSCVCVHASSSLASSWSFSHTQNKNMVWVACGCEYDWWYDHAFHNLRYNYPNDRSNISYFCLYDRRGYYTGDCTRPLHCRTQCHSPSTNIRAPHPSRHGFLHISLSSLLSCSQNTTIWTPDNHSCPKYEVREYLIMPRPWRSLKRTGWHWSEYSLLEANSRRSINPIVALHSSRPNFCPVLACCLTVAPALVRYAHSHVVILVIQKSTLALRHVAGWPSCRANVDKVIQLLA